MTGLHLAAYFGVDDAVRDLLGSNSPDLKESCSRTPLSWAAENGHEGAVTLLLAQRRSTSTRRTANMVGCRCRGLLGGT
jgi:ankyrin repeat protein